MLRVRQAEVEVDAAVAGPGLDRGQRREVDVVAAVDVFLARRGTHVLRRRAAQLTETGEGLPDPAEPGRDLRTQQVGDASADVVERVGDKGRPHPVLVADD